MYGVVCFRCGEAVRYDGEARAWLHASAPPEAASPEAWDRDHVPVPADDN